MKIQTSHTLELFGCLAWVHILKNRRHKLEPKSQEMIFIGYELGSKGYQFWDAAHRHFEISHDVKFEETQFPTKEMNLTQSTLVPLSDHQFPESDNEYDSSGLDLVNLAQPPTKPPSPGLSALGPPASSSQSARPPSPPCPTPGSTRLIDTLTRCGDCSTFNLQHLNILFVLQKNDKSQSNKLDLLQTVSTTF